jgi:hypothetical protein
MYELPKPEFPKTKFFILRSLSDKGLCLIIEAKDVTQAKEKANRFAADLTTEYQDALLFDDDERPN